MKNISSRMNVLLCLIVGCLFLFSGAGFCEEENPLKETVERTEELILTSHILDLEESAELKELLMRISNESKDLDLLQRISLKVTEKVIKDRTNLQFILTDLTKLAEEKYSAKMGGIKANNFKACWSSLKNLAKDMKKKRPKFNKPKEPLNIEDYKTILNSNSVFLTASEKVEMPSDLFGEIKKRMKKAFPAWEETCQDLLSQVNDNKEKVPEQLLDPDELKFLKVFGRVKLYWGILSGNVEGISKE